MKVMLVNIFCLLFFATAYSFEEGWKVDWYSKGDSGTNDNALCILEKLEEGWSVAVQESRMTGKSYYMASPIKSFRGVSLYEQTMLSKAESEWQRAETTIYMCMSDGNQLKHGDKRFIRTEGVSLGIFALFSQSWEKMCLSKNFNKILTAEFIPTPQAEEKKARFVNDLNSKEIKPKIERIELILSKDGFPVYSSVVRGAMGYWRISWDIFGGRVTYLVISEIHM